MKRRHSRAARPRIAAFIPRLGRAQAFPDRPVRFVVPYAPGGSTDTSLAHRRRAAVEILFGQQVMVENKPGGGTIIGTEIVAKARPDGYTILLTPGALAVNAAFGVQRCRTTSYKDLTPVARFVDLPLLLAANNDAPFKSVAELLAWPKAGPTAPFPTPRPASAACRICGASISRRAPACRSSMSATRAAPRRCAT